MIYLMLSRVIISGGGSGGHIFPAIAIGQAIRDKYPNCDLLYVGAEGKMEMEKVPLAGFEIIGLPIRGFQRGSFIQNLALPYRLLKSRSRARKMIKSFRPEVAVGVGGYASGPLLQAANAMKVPTLIQEQNSYAGLTNRILAPSTQLICVAYPDMEKYFPADKIALTGNPVRKELKLPAEQLPQAREYFGISDHYKQVVFLVGGSLGARTFNEFMLSHTDHIAADKETFYIWQYGRYYADQLEGNATSALDNVWSSPFVDRMDYALGAADVVITRAGAIALSELSYLEKAIIVIPSPNVVDDHQTKNAQAFSDQDACIMIKDENAEAELWSAIKSLVDDEDRKKSLEHNIKKLAFPNAVEDIVHHIERIV